MRPFGQQKYATTSCKFCTEYKDMTYNITRMRHHLEICADFLNDPSNASSDIVVKIRGVQMQRELENKNNNEEDNPPAKRQQTLEFSAMKKTTKKLLDTLTARAIFEGGRPLSIFEDPTMLRFLKALNPAYTPPSRRVISDVLLSEIFEEEKQKIEEILHGSDHINFTTDDASNINQERIVNLTAQTPQYGSFHLAAEDMSTFEHTAEQLTPRISQKMLL